MKLDPVRLAALDVLLEVQGGRLLDPVLGLAQNQLPESRDRAFLAEMVRGTVQWRERYRHVLSKFVTRRLPDDPALIQILFLSLHQMLAMGSVPPYAAIHQAGELCRARVSTRKVGFVNGVLQAVRRQLMPETDEKDQTPSPEILEVRLQELFADLASDPVKWLAAWTSHPQWLVKRWYDRFGRDGARSICEANNHPVSLGFRVLEPQSPSEAARLLAEAGCPVLGGSGSRRLVATVRPGRDLLDSLLERFDWLIVQDPVVQRATSWLHAARGEALEKGSWPGDRHPVLDMCAAPGGKTVRLAAAWPQAVPLLAMEPFAERMERLKDTLARTGFSRLPLIRGDGIRPPLLPGCLSAVLLDGPCSGTGVLRHHPEGRWRLQRKSPGRNGKVLLQLAEQAAELLVPGGVLLYATCSLERPENEDVVEALLDRREDLAPFADAKGRWQRFWLPGESDGDGFFAARLMKKNQED